MKRARRWTWLLFDAAVLAPALWQLVTLARIFWARIAYPMDLGWLEGAMLYQAYRFMHGQPIYGPPAQGFLPFGYPPLYHAVVGVVGSVVGLDYWTGRAVSIACFVLACGVLAREVWRAFELRQDALLMSILAVGSIAATFPVVAGWYDTIRNDSMTIALVCLAAGILSHGEWTARRIFIAALTLTASLYAKQISVFFAAWLCAFVLFSNPRMGLLLCATTAAASALILAVLQYSTHGWFWTWLMFGARDPINVGRVLTCGAAILKFAPFLPILPLLLLHVRRQGALSERSVLWFGMLIAAGPATLLPFIKFGGDWNDLIPVVFLAGPVALLLCADLIRGLGRGLCTPRAAVARAWVLLLASALVAAHFYGPDSFVPSAAVKAQAATLNDFVRALRGGVVIVSHPFLAVRNGHSESQLHTATYIEAELVGFEGLDVVGYVLSTGAQWVILDDDDSLVEAQLRTAFGSPTRIDPVVSTLNGRHAPRLLLRRRD